VKEFHLVGLQLPLRLVCTFFVSRDRHFFSLFYWLKKTSIKYITIYIYTYISKDQRRRKINLCRQLTRPLIYSNATMSHFPHSTIPAMGLLQHAANLDREKGIDNPMERKLTTLRNIMCILRVERERTREQLVIMVSSGS
jgi:hypothetical protein